MGKKRSKRARGERSARGASNVETISVDAWVIERARERVAWASLLRPLRALLAYAPSHRDTRRGRESARQLRVILYVIAGAFVLAERSVTTFVIAACALLIASILPMSRARKQGLRARLERAGSRDVAARRARQVMLDARRLALRDEGRLERRVLFNEAFTLRIGRSGQGDALVVRGASTRKRDTLVIVADGGGSAAMSSALGEDEEEVDVGALTDLPVFVDAASWRRLRDALCARRVG